MTLNFARTAAACLLLFAASLSAQLTHTWVSATGIDATCTGAVAKPCASFNTAAILTAAGGMISVLGPGDYGAITITKSLTIDGTGGGSIGFAGDAEGIYVNPSASVNVVIRNLTVDGGGTGSNAIYIASAGTANIVNVVIDGCHIEGFTNIGVGLASQSPTYVAVRNTAIQGGVLGVRTFQGTTGHDHVTLDHVTVQGATNAGVFTRNGNMDITNSTISGNIGTNVAGIQADTSATLNVQSSMITGNTNGVCIFASSTAVLGSSTTVADNATNIEACGGSVGGSGSAGPSPKL
ncbi:MAG TPA: hypothetical protein VG267_18970 [Terracidiphilus sp.]|jgi:hypothetical protein|nr:hypothetical protein [Terracidiphilus sp.]